MNKRKIILGTITFIFAIIVCLLYYNYRASNIVVVINEQKKETQKTSEPIKEKTFIVYITGQVKKPGLYNVTPGSRVIDVVNLAGGLTENANIDKVNLAHFVKDGEQINIIKSSKTAENHNTPTKAQEAEDNKVININKATVEDLQALPGVGKTTAENIVKYRQTNGLFKTKGDIKDVERIGDKTFEQFKDLITVN